MRILQNQDILKRQTDNYIRGELSNVAAAVQAPTILVDYYQVDLDKTTLIKGMRNVEDYIGPNSTVVYKHIGQLPMMGIDNLVSQASFDEELGFEEDFTQTGVTFPNTIIPKPYDCFMIPDSPVKALYMVSNITPVTIRSNPFTEIQFKLYTRSPEIIQHLLDQVQGEYVTTVTAIGMDKSLVIEKEAYFDIERHVSNYTQIVEMYQSLFYDQQKSAFVFDGLPGLDGGGCIGYQSKDDVNGVIPYEEITDPDHPWYGLQSKVSFIKNGDKINEDGDHLYIIDGEPIVVSDSYPYWMVRNHMDLYGTSNNFPGTGVSCCDCETCQNQNCPNSECPSTAYSKYIADEANMDHIVRQVFVDMTLWKLMFEEGIIIYDDVVTYTKNNFNDSSPRLYTDTPNLYVNEHFYKRSVLYRMAKRAAGKNPFEYIHPTCSEADPRIAKFQGKNIYYLERYDTTRDCNLNCGFYNVWDADFQRRIRTNTLYSMEKTVSYCGEIGQCELAKVYPFNTSLRNAIISGYNGDPIDWDNLELDSNISIDNYILIPILLAYYKEYITNLQK